MKKIIAVLLLAVMAAGVQAQIVTSRSSLQTKEKKQRIPIKVEWYAKAGLNLMQANPGEMYAYGYNKPSGNQMKAGFNLGVGMLSHFRPSRPSNFYWGFELGLTQIGGGWDGGTFKDNWLNYTYYFTGISFSKLGGYLAPTIGWKKSVLGDLKVNVHLAPQVSLHVEPYHPIIYYREVSANGSSYDGSRHLYNENPSLSVEGGVGIWYKHLIIDLSYRRSIDVRDSDYNPSNIILSVGVNF